MDFNLFQNIFHTLHQLAHTALNKAIAAHCVRRSNWMRHNEYLAVLIKCQLCSNHTSPVNSGCCNQCSQAHSANYTIADGKVSRIRSRTQWKLRDDSSTTFHNICSQPLV